MMETCRVGKRGTVVIPSELRRRFGIKEGSLVIAEARDDGVMIRPAVAVPVDVDRRLFLEEANRDYAALRADPAAWRGVLAERELWDATLHDGLTTDEMWTEAGSVERREPAEGG